MKLYVMNIVSVNVARSISANVKSTMVTNSVNKYIRYKMYCFILHTVLLVIILLFTIAIICYHCAKQKGIGALTIQT